MALEAIATERETARPLRVLLVEDSPSDALLVKALLQAAQNPFSVTAVPSFADACTTLASERLFDCVLLDLGLPDADGFEALSGILTRATGTAVVVLTGRDDYDHGVAAVAGGAQDYLVKGDVTGPALARSIRYAVERSSAIGTSARLAAIVEASGDAILRLGLDGSIETWNRGAEQMYGYSATETIGRSPTLLAAADRTEEMLGLIEQARAGRSSTIETEWRSRSDVPIDVLVDACPIRLPDGRVTAISIVTRDVTLRRHSEDRLAFQGRLLDAAGQAIIATDPEGHITYWNHAAEHLYGWTAAEVSGLRLDTVVSAGGDARTGGLDWSELRCGHRWAGDFRARHRDGTHFPAFVDCSPIIESSGKVSGVISVSNDVSDRETARLTLTQGAERLAEAQRVARLGSWELDRRTGVVHWSDEQYRQLGFHPGEVTPSVDTFVSRILPSDQGLARRAFENLSRRGEPIRIEVRAQLPDRDVMWLEVRGEPVYDGERDLVGARLTCQDVTIQKHSEATLEHLALYDPVTRLANRTLLEDRLATAHARARRDGEQFGVLFIDIDHFKLINDTRGHRAGDELLRQLANRLQSVSRAVDTVARFGGDEFVILVEGIESSAAIEALADRLHAAMASPFEIDGARLLVTVSMGIAIGTDGESVEMLLSAADSAMYHAKEQGRAQHRTFDRTLRERAEMRLATENALRAALPGHQLRLVYQPVVDLRSGRIVAAEALVRWDHPTRGIVGPADFIPLAEDIGVIGAIGAWVLEEACAELRALSRLQPTVMMSVNVSAKQLAQPTFPAFVASTIDLAGLQPERITLEITESILMEGSDHFLARLGALKDIGVLIAMDDFGTGYSSLSYMRRFPFDVIKIDRAFVTGVDGDPHDEALVSAALTVVGALGMSSQAEGVETVGQLAKLRDLHCDFAQGYLFARPLCPSALHDLVTSAPVW